jgi:hypothetical protein
MTHIQKIAAAMQKDLRDLYDEFTVVEAKGEDIEDNVALVVFHSKDSEERAKRYPEEPPEFQVVNDGEMLVALARQDDNGVRNYPDGSGEPPSSDYVALIHPTTPFFHQITRAIGLHAYQQKVAAMKTDLYSWNPTDVHELEHPEQE